MWRFAATVSRSTVLPLCRGMTVYPVHYIEPIIDQSKQQEQQGRLTHVPTKAARNSESTSVYYNELVQKLTNYMTKGGRKQLSRELLTKTLENIKRVQIERMNLAQSEEEKANIITDPEKLLITAIENSRPFLQLTAIKRGGVNYQVPIPVTEKRSYFLAMNWLLEAARDKERKVHLPEKLAWEILDAAYGQGRVVKRKNDLHRQCEGNRAYAHYRWS